MAAPTVPRTARRRETKALPQLQSSIGSTTVEDLRYPPAAFFRTNWPLPDQSAEDEAAAAAAKHAAQELAAVRALSPALPRPVAAATTAATLHTMVLTVRL